MKTFREYLEASDKKSDVEFTHMGAKPKMDRKTFDKIQKDIKSDKSGPKEPVMPKSKGTPKERLAAFMDLVKKFRG